MSSKNLFRIHDLLSEAVTLVTETAIRRGNISERYVDERYGRCRSIVTVEAEAGVRK